LIKGDFAAKTVDISGSLGVTGSISTSGSNGTINNLFIAQVVEMFPQTSQLVHQQTLAPLQQVEIILQQEMVL
jgi:hypothetical protein